MHDPIDVGDVVVLTITLRDPAKGDELTDSGSVAVDVRSPDGTVQTIPAERKALGTYEAHVPATASGTWYVEAKATGELEGVTPARFYVRPSEVHR